MGGRIDDETLNEAWVRQFHESVKKAMLGFGTTRDILERIQFFNDNPGKIIEIANEVYEECKSVIPVLELERYKCENIVSVYKLIYD